jgi:cyclase
MSPRTLHLALAPAGALLLATTLLLPLRQQGEVEVRTQPMAGNVHVLFGRGGNVGVAISDEGVLLIDNQFQPLAPAIRAAVDELSGGKPIRYLLNTHWHPDHTGGNPVFGQEALIVAHENVRRRLEGDDSLAGNLLQPAMEEVGLPEITFGGDGLTIHFGGEAVRVLHYPHAHTDGDAVIWFTGSNVAHLGDLYFSGTYPFIDLASGGTVEGFVAAVGDLLELLPDDIQLIAGHGEPTDKAALREYHEMLVESVARARGALAEGQTAREMSTSGLMTDLDERWGGSTFIPPGRWLEILTTGLR